EELTGQENLAFFGRMQGLNGEGLTSRIGQVLDLVELSDRAADRVKSYSGGMKRRLNLAVALIHDPPLLLFDEPTVGVDPQSRNAIFEKILHLKELGKTIVYTTHYMEEAERLCDRVGIMDRGKLLALDTIAGLIDEHGGGRVINASTNKGTLREVSDNPLARLTEIQNDQGLLDFSVETPDLESVFLNLTGRALRD
ncbi:MAG: ABC transporter ATP-binding protein, partial [Phycisphaerae bacterium]